MKMIIQCMIILFVGNIEEFTLCNLICPLCTLFIHPMYLSTLVHTPGNPALPQPRPQDVIPTCTLFSPQTRGPPESPYFSKKIFKYAMLGMTSCRDLIYTWPRFTKLHNHIN